MFLPEPLFIFHTSAGADCESGMKGLSQTMEITTVKCALYLFLLSSPESQKEED